jgi:hypothetical protein
MGQAYKNTNISHTRLSLVMLLGFLYQVKGREEVKKKMDVSSINHLISKKIGLSNNYFIIYS